ncbi:anthranilate synthase component I family protein [Deltaproteobacteria bacterium OttesenSCG-928-K17]|nr:anthranilate synthase component I family protein [Deltaproteobacteria bacterium OttesenSCG-928-K17]
MPTELVQHAEILENDIETVISLFLRRIGRADGILLESAEVDGRWGRFSLVAGDFLLLAGCAEGRLKLTINDARLEGLKIHDGRPYFEGLKLVMNDISIKGPDFKNALPPITRALYGYLGYGAGASVSSEKNPAADGAGGVFGLPGNVYLFDHSYNQLTRLSLFPPNSSGEKPALPFEPSGQISLGPVASAFSKAAYLKAADGIIAAIKNGEVVEAFLSNRFSAPFKGELFDVYRKLRKSNPSPYMFFLRQPGFSMAVSSPAVLLGCQKGRLNLSPIAGSRPRGRDLEEDSLFEEELFSSPKEKAEHAMLVDVGRSDLGGISVPGSVKVERFMEVERFARAMHLSSRLTAALAGGLDAVDALRAVFPSGSVTGVPKSRAMEIIGAREPLPRGPFGGALGWLGLDKDAVNLDLGLTIRGFWAAGGRLLWQTGSGLVHNSDSDQQWQSILKTSAEALEALEINDAVDIKNLSGGEECSF